VVVSFLNYTNVLALAACRGLPVPVIVSERADPRVVDIGPAWSALRRLTYRNCALLIAQTPTIARLFEPLACGRVRVIPNPVQLPAATPAAAAAAQPAVLQEPTILALGRLHHQKGFDLAIRALALLPAECDAWKLVILGEGPARQELEAIRDELGLAARVSLPGAVPEPGAWLRQAQIFLLPSRSEGFPNALCEAMAAGLPVVAADCRSGPADIITPEVDGLLVPPEDPRALAAALARLARSPELRTRLARNAPAVVERFSLTSVLAAWDGAFRETMSARSTTGGVPR
jgi:glycosyltransferase involved in cell wall biosynthesis